MISIVAGNRTFELFGSIKELPILRYKRMHHFLLQESGIGSTMVDIDYRMGKTVSLLQSKNHDEAITELTNLRYSFFSAISELDFKSMAFACFIHKIDGQEFNDISSEGLTEVVRMLHDTEITVGQMEAHWESVKKKLIPNSEPISQDGSEMTLSTLTT
jgi:hypothetical protein